MLFADLRDLKKAYNCNYASYRRLKQSTPSYDDRKAALLLLYAVECGLKYMLIDRWRIGQGLKKMLEIYLREKENCNDNDLYRRAKILTSHNIEAMLIYLGQAGTFKFYNDIMTVHQDKVNSSNMHELFRYCIAVQSRSSGMLAEQIKQFEKIAEWIRSEMI